MFSVRTLVVLVAAVNVVKGTNLARDKDTTQSSTWRNSVSSFSVDGFLGMRTINGAWGCSHMNEGGNKDWWAVDLGDVYDVQRVVVRSRTDTCCRNRFSNINVDVIMPVVCNQCDCDKWATFQNGETSKCFYSPGFTLPITQDKTCLEGARGRFVRVYRTDSDLLGTLNLCEVEVYGSPANISEKEIGDMCTTTGSTAECLDENAVCTDETNRKKCRCRFCYYDNDLDNANVGGNCIRKKVLGEKCNSPGNAVECQDYNAVCTPEDGSHKCRCKTGFIDNDQNQNNIGGNCTMIGTPDNEGTEFLIAFMENLHDKNQLELVMMTNSATEVNVKITSPGWTNPSINEQFTLASKSMKELKLSLNLRLNGNVKQKKGILISSSDEIVVYGVNKQLFTTDAFLCLPTDVISNEYYVMTFHPTSTKTQLALVGVEDDTIVSVKIGSCPECGPVTFLGTTYKTNDSFDVNLDRYEVIQLQSNGDLTGTYITSDKKISVFSGNKITSVGSGISKDHLSVQLTPVNTWGKKFVSLPTPYRTVGDFFKIITSEVDTVVFYKCNRNGILNLDNFTLDFPGDFKQLHIASEKYCFISSDKSIMVAQIVLSQPSPGSNDKTDPSMVIIPPMELYDNEYRFNTIMSSQQTFQHILCFAINANDKSGLRLNGSPLPSDTAYHDIPDTDLVGGFIPVSDGYYHIHHISPISVFTVMFYGYVQGESYMIYPGIRMAPINTVCVPTNSESVDGLDNDCDGLIDEELCHVANQNQDDDGDGRVNEDCTESPPTLCRDEWREFKGSCYFFSTDKLKFDEARSSCESIYGKLAEPLSVEHISFLRELAKELAPTEHTYIGGSDREKEGSFVWIDSGEPVSVTDWNNNQPNNAGGNQHCIAILSKQQYNSKWNDAGCNLNYRYICEEPRPQVKPTENGELECKLNTVTKFSLTFGMVKWYLGDEQVKEILYSYDNSLQSTISMSALPKRFGMVKCTIEGLSNDNTTLVTLKGHEFFVGIKMDSEVTVEKGGHTTVGFRLTAPLSCPDCKITLKVTHIEASPPSDICSGDVSLFEVKGCDINVDIMGLTWNSTQRFSIKHRPNGGYGVQQSTFTIQVEATIVDKGLTFISAITDKTLVNVIQNNLEWRKKTCTAYCDPHMKTFDGVYYEHQQEGTYYLYRNKAFNSGLEVQMKLSSCNRNRAYCACGVAIRAGADVFMMNLCNRKSTIDFVSCEYNPVLEVAKTKDNKNYLITMPTGTLVTVRIVSMRGVKFFNVVIRPSLDDVDNTEGLCGTLSNNCTDDFKTPDGTITNANTMCHKRKNYRLWDIEFSNSWRVPLADDLFNPGRASILTQWQYSEQLCRCTTNESGFKQSCNVNPYVYCTPPKSNPVEAEVIECRKSVEPNKTRIVSFPEVPGLFTITEPEVGENDVIILNETEAVDFCTENIQKSPAFGTCTNVDGIVVDKFIEICAIDTQLTGSKLWVENAIELLREDCFEEIEMNGPIPNTPAQLQNLCPGLTGVCNGHGNCEEGQCVCEAGFTLSDCSARTDTPPEITVMKNKGLCDSSVSNCTKISVYGPDIDVAGDVYCKVQPFLVKTDLSVNEEVVILTGKAISLFEIQCILPPTADINNTNLVVRGYNISVGYTRNSFSTTTLRYFDYDSKCQTPGETSTAFSISDNTCFIEGQCLSNGDVNSGDRQQVCNSLVSKYKWTSYTGPTLDVSSTSQCLRDDSLWIGVAIASGSVVILSVCFCCLWLVLFRRRQKRKERAYMSSYYKDSITDFSYMRKDSKAMLIRNSSNLAVMGKEIEWSNGIYGKESLTLKKEGSTPYQTVFRDNRSKSEEILWSTGLNDKELMAASGNGTEFCEKCGSPGKRCGSWYWVCNKVGRGQYGYINFHSSKQSRENVKENRNGTSGIWLYRHIETKSEDIRPWKNEGEESGSSFKFQDSKNLIHSGMRKDTTIQSQLKQQRNKQDVIYHDKKSFDKDCLKSEAYGHISTFQRHTESPKKERVPVKSGSFSGKSLEVIESQENELKRHGMDIQPARSCIHCNNIILHDKIEENSTQKFHQMSNTLGREKWEGESEIWYSVSALVPDVEEVVEYSEDESHLEKDVIISEIRNNSQSNVSDTNIEGLTYEHGFGTQSEALANDVMNKESNLRTIEIPSETVKEFVSSDKHMAENIQLENKKDSDFRHVSAYSFQSDPSQYVKLLSLNEHSSKREVNFDDQLDAKPTRIKTIVFGNGIKTSEGQRANMNRTLVDVDKSEVPLTQKIKTRFDDMEQICRPLKDSDDKSSYFQDNDRGSNFRGGELRYFDGKAHTDRKSRKKTETGQKEKAKITKRSDELKFRYLTNSDDNCENRDQKYFKKEKCRHYRHENSGVKLDQGNHSLYSLDGVHFYRGSYVSSPHSNKVMENNVNENDKD